MPKKFELSKMLIHLLFILLSLAIVLPFLLVVAVSLTDEASLTDKGYQFFPETFSLEAYRYLLDAPDILLRAYGVTITVTVIGALAGLLLTAMTAYVISRPDYRYNRVTTFYVFFTMLFSGGLVPSYILITQYLHLKDSLLALILPVLLSPFNIMVMKGFMSKIPLEIVESAKIDGARELRIFFRIILPLSTPALATLGLLISFTYWNEWFNAMLYIDDPDKVPLQLLLVRTLGSIEFITSNSEFSQQLGIDLSSFPNNSARMAIAVLAGGPMLIIFPFFQRFFVKGLTVGSLKG
ncbi:putative aldouronate transport system permease protein [Paenibacillus sp. cl141a]|uniref:carbohydrate ABC transporter permease n=1 Tax=Paenibacillus TaxID=44249 RepID=UPI0008BE4201|nr:MULTISPECIES: carbohydrate ABC transporter permease [Paenibacillus]PCL92842.1 carbohydrate ABC transporter permease [Paenibacillus lautus]QOT12563.1 carbohydrate ABC transporter permease [Paenibacillus sp. JNUCC-32]WFB61398.1 carbohydrate ABC transporter permease [Paenibacillus sp. BR1-192]SEM54452.1 putative aldouronate transport system permease protein [Paenibacillus sp. cl141a]GIP02853.1 sugar ABC transporter permease [Paenibacillus lautus]